MLQPSWRLRWFILTVDIGFVVYWVITTTGLLPPEWLYAHHDDPMMVAWNWSFLPLDMLVSASGLTALWLARRADPRWLLLCLASLAFCIASGVNAIAFWALRHDFDFTWWAPNLVLALGPAPFIWTLVRTGPFSPA